MGVLVEITFELGLCDLKRTFLDISLFFLHKHAEVLTQINFKHSTPEKLIQSSRVIKQSFILYCSECYS